jgi:hypothetical protein
MYSVSSRFLFPFLFSIYYFFIPAIAIFNFFFGLFLLRRREWAWKLGIVTLLFSIIVHGFFVFLSVSFFGRNPEILLTGFLGFGIPFIGSLIPLILLLLDRKNFWKVAS